MIADCINDKTDKLVLVSGDSDLVPPVEFILKQYKEKGISVYFPPTINSSNLFNIMRYNRSKTVRLENNLNKIQKSIMSDTVSANGISYSIPKKWK